MDIKRNILFFLDLEAGKTDAKIRMRIRYGGGTVVNFNVGYRADVDKWSKEVQRCKAKTTHGKKKVSASEINAEIQRLEDMALKVFKAFESNERVPSADEFRLAFNEANRVATGATPKEKRNFFSIWDEFTSTMGRQNSWTKATYTKFASIRGHLHGYNPKISLKTLSENDLLGFITYLQSIPSPAPKRGMDTGNDTFQQVGLRNTTIAKTLTFVRWFLRWAYARGYYEGNLHTTWRPKLKGTDGNQKEVIHLTWNELMHLNSFQVPETKQYLDRVKDVFLFQCFTGLRYSDVAKLQRSDVKSDHIEVVTQKTVDGLKIELNNYSRAILDKYADYHLPGDKALPVVSNVKMNEYLKELGRLAGLDDPQRIVYFMGSDRVEEVYKKWQLLTTHCGRRTFIVNALYLGIPAEVLMRWTGHSDFKAMKPYVKIVDELKAKEMEKFNR